MIKIKLPDGSVIEGAVGNPISDHVSDVKALVARVDDRLIDLSCVIEPSFKEITILDFHSKEGRDTYWHTSAHILALAVKELHPEARLAIGPAIETGFYYDFDVGDKMFTPTDLERIERKMEQIISIDTPMIREELSREDAIKLFQERDEPFKVELLREVQDQTVSVYWLGDFVDLCRGPHLPSSGYVKNIKLLNASSAYWRGDEKGPVLQRIYGVSFPDKSMLDAYLNQLEEAKRRDHRILGPELDLFSIHEEIGSGLIVWHPKGAIIRRILEDFWIEEHLKRGYQLSYSPHIARSKLWEISGHIKYYVDSMYFIEKDGETFVLKPMNCPPHILVYKSKLRSYRDLPIRYAELGTVYRYERMGTLHGLLRVRGFTQDDAHIFCTREQLEDEVIDILDLMSHILKSLGFVEYKFELSTRDPETPEKYMGSDEDWALAQGALTKALEKEGLHYEEMRGEAVFYGPKIDVKLVDSMGRAWQCTTIQIDFNLPRRFDVTYIGPDGKEHPIVMIHRTILGSLERFFGILIEHYAGNFPLWLASVQVKVIPISDKYDQYAKKVHRKLLSEGIRSEIDGSLATLSYKIRSAEKEKIPYMVVVGKKEEQSKNIAVRKHRHGDLGSLSLQEFIKMLKAEIQSKKIS